MKKLLKIILTVIAFCIASLSFADNPDNNLIKNGDFKHILTKNKMPTHWYIPPSSVPFIDRQKIPGYGWTVIFNNQEKFINLSQRFSLPERQNHLYRYSMWFRCEKLREAKPGFEFMATLRFEFFDDKNKRIDRTDLLGRKRPWILTRHLPIGNVPWTCWTMLLEAPVNAAYCIFSIRTRNLSGKLFLSEISISALNKLLDKKKSVAEKFSSQSPLPTLIEKIEMSNGALPPGWFIPYSRKDISGRYLFNKGEKWLTMNDPGTFPPVEIGYEKTIRLEKASVTCRLPNPERNGAAILFWGDSYSTHIREGKWWYELRYQSGMLILKKQGKSDLMKAIKLPQKYQDRWINISMIIPSPGEIVASIDGKLLLTLLDPNPPTRMSGLFRVIARNGILQVKDIALYGMPFSKEKSSRKSQFRDPFGRVPTKPVEVIPLKNPDKDLIKLPYLTQWTCNGIRTDQKKLAEKYKTESSITYDLKTPENSLYLGVSKRREFKLPQVLMLQFNTSKSGFYTLYFSGRGGENFSNRLKVTLNEKEIYWDCHRGSGLWAGYPYFKIKIPLKLQKGSYRLTFTYQPPNLSIPYLKKTFYGYGFGFSEISLTPGISSSPPEYVLCWREAVKNIKIHAHNNLFNHQTMDPDFRYVITDVPEGEYEIELGIRDDHVDLPHLRIFNVYVQGDLLKEKLDPARNAEKIGFPIILKKKIIVGKNKQITVRAKKIDGPASKALLSYIKIFQNNKLVALVNCGRTSTLPEINPVSYSIPRKLQGKTKRSRPMWLEDKGKGLFNKNNLVVNPGLEKNIPEGNKEYKLAYGWKVLPRSQTVFTPKLTTGKGTAKRDDTVAKSGKYSLRIEKTDGTFGGCGNITWINRHRPYKFSAWVKGKKATGKTYIQLEWLKRRPFGKYTSGDWDHLYERADITSSNTLNGDFDWRKIEVSAIPPEDAVAVSFLLRSDDNSGTVWFDDLSCDAFGNAPVEILYSQGGYDTKGLKKPIVSIIRKHQNGTLKLIDSKTGKTVEEKPLTFAGKDTWINRFCYTADFSKYSKPGTYKWIVNFKNEPSLASDTFPIHNDFWQKQAQLGLKFHRIVRSGDKHPEWNPKGQHMDDFRLPIPSYQRGPITLRKGANIDGKGGWYDAADHGLFLARSISGIYALAEMLETLPEKSGKQNPSLKKAINDELTWGVDKFIKLSLPNGMMYQNLAYVLHTDNIPYTGDERVPLAIGQPYNYFGTMAKAAYALKKTNPALAEKTFKLAELSYEKAIEHWYKKKNIPAWKEFYMQPKFLLAETYLWKYTGDKKYLDKARERITAITKFLEQKTYHQKTYLAELGIGASGLSFGLDFIDIPAQFARYSPDSPELEEYKSELKKYLDNVLVKQCRKTPFGQVTHFDPATDKPFLCYSSTVFGFPSVASALASATELLNDPSYSTHAERQLQWMLGRNIMGLSMIGGVGRKQCAQDHGYEPIYASTEGKQIPGAVSKGINIGKGTISKNWGTPYETPYAIAQPSQTPGSHYEFIQMPSALQMLATWKLDLRYNSNRD